MNLLEVKNISKTYGNGETAVKALKDVCFSVPKGEYVAIVGESGSGKSTLLNMIGALDTPTSGKVLIDGKDIFSMNDKKLTVFRRRNIGFIFQAFNLVPELTVEQNIIFPVLLDHQKPDKKYLEELLAVLNLKERRNHLPSQLSGGQQQRVAIGRALITRPALILADEPTGNLDTQNSSEVIALLKEASKKYEQTIIMITHNRSIAQTADRDFAGIGRCTDRLREVPRMKSYLSLIPISAKVRKRQNRMTMLCIIISVLLVTMIFSMADMAIRMEKTRVIKEHGNWHIMLKEPSEQQIEQIAQRTDVMTSSRYDGLNFDLSEDYTINGKSCVIVGGDNAILTEIYDNLTEGRYPTKENEILLSNRSKELLSLKIGEAITVHTPAGDFGYTISGFGGDVTITTDADIVGAFLNWDSFQSLAKAEGSKLAPVCFVRFYENIHIRKVIAELRKTYGFTDETLSENTALLGLTGFSSDSYVMGMYLVAAILFVLVLAAGVFMIAGSLNSRTAERTQFFGMLRCIGASRAQVMRIVKLEALYWCKTAVPIGVIVGIVGTWMLCALLRFGAGAEFVQIPLFGISSVGIISGIVVGVLTVLLSSISPARRAAGVSPVAAVTGNLSENWNTSRPIKQNFLKIEMALGIHHAVSSPKNLLLMTGSFALSIIMILSFSVLIQWVNMALNPLKPWAPDVFYSSPDNLCDIKQSFAKEVESRPYVKRVFGRMYQSLPAEYEGKLGQIDLISYENQQFQWAAEDLIAGDISAVSEGNGVLTVFDKSNSLKVGDTIQLEQTELTVAGVLKDSPFDTSDQPTVICSEKTFKEITGKDAYAVLDVQLSKKATEQNVNDLHVLANGHYRFYDRLAQNKDTQNTYFMFCLFVYGFLAVITLITIIHTVNSISMSVSARTNQYGAMRAVGMDSLQIKKMILMETATYTTLGLLAGCGLGLPLHHFLYSQMITNYWGTAWQIPLTSIGEILVLLVFTSLLAPFAPAKRICNMPITATINEL